MHFLQTLAFAAIVHLDRIDVGFASFHYLHVNVQKFDPRICLELTKKNVLANQIPSTGTVRTSKILDRA